MKIEHLRSLQTKSPLEKLPTPNMIRMSGRTAEGWHTK